MGAWIETTIPQFVYEFLYVAPYMGAWIETSIRQFTKEYSNVAPYMGAWIETEVEVYSVVEERRTLYGCVD